MGQPELPFQRLDLVGPDREVEVDRWRIRFDGETHQRLRPAEQDQEGLAQVEL
jgi:hypothetical protein